MKNHILPPKNSAFSDLVIEVFRLNRQLLDAGDRLTQPVGLSSARWQVLGVVEHGPVTVPNVAREMGLTRQAILQVADSLVAEEYIRYEDNPHHRRAKLMVITPKGRTALDEIQRRHAVWTNRITEQLPIERLTHMLDEIRHIRELLDQSNSLFESPDM